MKKYQRYIVQEIQANEDGERALRSFYFRVEKRDGKWVAASKPVEIRDGHSDLFHETGLLADSVMIQDAPRQEGLAPIELPDGYRLLAQHWLPDNYVPESDEVMEERERRASEDMKDVMKQISDFKEGRKNNG